MLAQGAIIVLSLPKKNLRLKKNQGDKKTIGASFAVRKKPIKKLTGEALNID
ncbi:MAG TPA: hypothetical protein VEB42_12075 [Chitinophagaceae bacterium]|nr:hypothetical protein [Chitinophagaceae bacterium]